MSPRLNVLVVMSDEQSWDTLGCTGNPAARTPHVDELAADGTVFDGLFTPFPLCCPSRTSLITSLMPRHHHVLGNWRGIRPDVAEQGIGTDFATAGYHTIYCGKWHVPGTTPTRMGFADTVAIPAVLDGKDRGRYIEPYREFATAAGYELVPGNIENLTPDDLAGLRDPAAPHRTTSVIDLDHYLETWQTDQFLAALDRADPDRPWFAVCSYNAPHFPFSVPRPYDTLIDRSRITLPPTWELGPGALPDEVSGSHFATKFADLDEAGWVDVIGHYYGLCSLVDDQLGRIVAELRRRGELDRTIIVYTSDHGDMMGAYRLVEKGHLLHYDETMRVPLVIRHPDGDTSRNDALLSMVDLGPTLAELAGVPVDRPIDGRSGAALVGDATASAGREHVFGESLLWELDSESAAGEHRDPAGFDPDRDALNLSVRTRTHRYNWRSRDRDELADLTAADPTPRPPAAEQAGLVAALRRTIAAEVGDVFPDAARRLTGPADPSR